MWWLWMENFSPMGDSHTTTSSLRVHAWCCVVCTRSISSISSWITDRVWRVLSRIVTSGSFVTLFVSFGLNERSINAHSVPHVCVFSTRILSQYVQTKRFISVNEIPGAQIISVKCLISHKSPFVPKLYLFGGGDHTSTASCLIISCIYLYWILAYFGEWEPQPIFTDRKGR